MRIALSGGQKTINITTAIESKIQSGGDDLVTLPSIDDLIEYIDCGYKIDRVLISEQSITANGEVADVTTIRNTINGICRLLHSKEHDAKVVFFTSYNDLAEVIYDESLEVRANSIIILKDKPYSTSFFIEILTSELDKINREWFMYHTQMKRTSGRQTEKRKTPQKNGKIVQKTPQNPMMKQSSGMMTLTMTNLIQMKSRRATRRIQQKLGITSEVEV